MATFSVSYDSDAKEKIEKAINWNNFKSPGLGDKLSEHLLLQINSLKENPWRHAIRDRDIRSMLIKSHPYRIDYLIKEADKNVVIYDFIHQRSGPHHQPRRS